MKMYSLLLLSLVAGIANAHLPGSCDPLPFDKAQEDMFTPAFQADISALAGKIQTRVASRWHAATKTVPAVQVPTDVTAAPDTTAVQELMNKIAKGMHTVYNASYNNAGKIVLTASALIAVGYTISELIKAKQKEKTEAESVVPNATTNA